jgi:hypothetical protein
MLAALIGLAGVLLGVALGAVFQELQRRRVAHESVRAATRELEPVLSSYVSRLGRVLRESHTPPFARTMERRLREFAPDREAALVTWSEHRAAFAKVLPSDQWYTLSHGLAALERLSPEDVVSLVRTALESDPPPPEESSPLIIPLVGDSMSQTFAVLTLFMSMTALYDGAVVLAQLGDGHWLADLQSGRAQNKQMWDEVSGDPAGA